MNTGQVLGGAKRLYAGAARATGAGLTRSGLLPRTPPGRDHRLQHWAYSLTRVHDSVAIAELDVPWWTYRAIDVVEAWLSARPRPVRVFEYGSGASTLWLSHRADEVHSVEHHRGFGDYIAEALLRAPNIHLRIVEPVSSASPLIPSSKEGCEGLDFADYVATIGDVGGSFDLIVIDGRAREACLRRALPHLADSGVIVFDNTRRPRYRRAISLAPVDERRLAGLTPTLPYPEQTSLLRHGGSR